MGYALSLGALCAATLAMGALGEAGGGEAGGGETSPCAHTGFLNKSVTAEGAARRYVLYVPWEYTPEEAWPLIVFLHGAGERGDDGLIQTEVGIGTAVRRNPERFPALILMPQCPKGRFWDAAIPHIETAIAETQAEYRVDEDRIYLTGLSMGGYGTWMWGAQRQDLFAALMPICGGAAAIDLAALAPEGLHHDFGSYEERVRALARMPVWAFHGKDDPVVPVMRSETVVNAVKRAGGDPKLTVYKDTGHNSWDRAYGDRRAIAWLLSQRKKR